MTGALGGDSIVHLRVTFDYNHYRNRSRNEHETTKGFTFYHFPLALLPFSDNCPFSTEGRPMV